MATKNTGPAAPSPADIKEELPQRGGSYVRNPDGTLAQTEGPDLPKQTPNTQEQ